MGKQSRTVSKMLPCRSVLVWTISIFLLITRVCDGSSARTHQTASSNSASTGADDGHSQQGRLTPDRFVSAAPLIIAAVCSDGVAILATHTAFSDEPLILDDDEAHENSTTTATTNNLGDVKMMSNETVSNTTITRMPRDLPRSYRGPFRINLIDGYGTSLVCAGWRADGEMLAQACRSLASSELAVFGEPSFRTCEYGHYIASEASLWMAQCAVSESVSFRVRRSRDET
jgi:hypothetical protein